MKNLEFLQAQFSLFQAGDKTKVSVITLTENGGAKVKTLGGCIGNILSGVPSDIYAGAIIDVIVTDVKDGVPVFEMTPEYRLTSLPQEAKICFSGPRAIVMEFCNFAEIYGVYEPAKGLSEELQNLQPNTCLIASKIKAGKDAYKVGKIEIAPMQEALVPVAKADIMQAWTKEKIAEVVKIGSRKMYGKVSLGKIYPVKPYGKDRKLVQFTDGQVGALEGEALPTKCESAFVRVTFITQSNKLTAKIVKVEREPMVKENEVIAAQGENLAQGEEAKSDRNRYRNDDVFKKGLANGSLHRAGGYWLGYNYKATVKNGKPYFTPSDTDKKNILGDVNVVVREGSIEYKFTDVLCVEIAHIRLDDAQKHNYTFEVNILRIF